MTNVRTITDARAFVIDITVETERTDAAQSVVKQEMVAKAGDIERICREHGVPLPTAAVQ